MSKAVRRLAGTVGVLALVLCSAGTAAAEDEFPPPVNIRNNTTSPGCLSVIWEHYASNVNSYSVAIDNGPQINVGTVGKYDPPTCFAPESTHHLKVCAHYATEDGDEACEEADLTTARAGHKVGELDNPQDKPTPPIVMVGSGKDWVDLEWGWRDKGARAGFDYDKYYVWLSPTNGDPLVTHEEGGGNWGYWKFPNLKPGTLYRVQVQGCTESDIPFVEGTCWGKSAWRDISTKADLVYGPDTCKQGFVWRNGTPDDHICVTPERRQKVADDLSTGKQRMQQGQLKPLEDLSGRCSSIVRREASSVSDGCWQLPQCFEPFVPRDIPGEQTLVCVDQKEADLIKQENANPRANMAQP